MKEITPEESKRIMVKILESIHNCCRENNIKYSLCWGTMIGAIRHQGFIPWDDDIDIMMPREDYNRFLQIYNDSTYGVYTPRKNKNCIQIITKIYDKNTRVYYHNHPKSLFGIWVSIFPYDNVPVEDLERWEKKRTFWMKLYHIKTTRFFTTNSFKKRIGKAFLKLLLLPFSSFLIYDKVESCLTAYNGQKTGRICIWPGVDYLDFKYYPDEWFEEFIEIGFEDTKTMIIKNYDDFLRSRYGDYMTFPPEKERVPKHKYKAFYDE